MGRDYNVAEKHVVNCMFCCIRFPQKNLDLMELWKTVCKFKKSKYITNLYVCSMHFQKEDYIEYNAKELGGKLKLRPQSVPSVNVPCCLKPTDTLVTVDSESEQVEFEEVDEVQSSNLNRTTLVQTSTGTDKCVQVNDCGLQAVRNNSMYIFIFMY